MRPTKENAPEATEARFDTKQNRNSKRLPPYGKQFMTLREGGKAPSKMVVVSFDWDLAKAYPRIIIPDNLDPSELEFTYLAGLPVQIIFRSKDAHRVNGVAHEIMQVNPCFLATFALDLEGTGDAWTIIQPYLHVEIAEAA